MGRRVLGRLMCQRGPEIADPLYRKPVLDDWWRKTQEAERVDRSQVPMTSWTVGSADGPAPGQQRAPGASQQYAPLHQDHVLVVVPGPRDAWSGSRG